ncbi:MAG: class I adenylate-forming enzyme family protein [Methylococcaceae bacterium]
MNLRHDLSDHYLTDGQSTCYYPDILRLLNLLDVYLHEQGITYEDCIALECNNTVPGALSILLMLYRSQGFVLLPPSENKEEVSRLKPIPRFCTWRIRILPIPKDQTADWMNDPGRYLSLEKCSPAENSHRLADDEIQGRLFLRTSGSMGAAKLVVHTHERLLGNADNVRKKYGFTADDRATIPVPIFHMYGMGAEFLPALLAGASMDLQENTNLLKYLDRERRFKPTIAFITPNLCEMLLQGKRTPTPYKIMVVSGQRFREDLFQAFDPLCGGRLVNQYGSSEMGATAACDPDDSFDLRLSTIGKPMPGVELRLDEVTEGVGKLRCRHPFGYLGYMDDNGTWLKKSDEWHDTGDIGRLDDKGFIEVLGRADDSINRSGYLVLLADIERQIGTITGVAMVTVLATQNVERIHGQQIVAFCQPDAGVSLDIKWMRSVLEQTMPRYAIPDQIHILDEVPLLPSGKIDRQTLLKSIGE